MSTQVVGDEQASAMAAGKPARFSDNSAAPSGFFSVQEPARPGPMSSGGSMPGQGKMPQAEPGHQRAPDPR